MAKKGYSIIASAEAFDTLSKKLYSNPVLAIIRELSCNAQDSQKIANQNKQFDLHIPTEEEPYFDIRDYGTGMSEDFVMDIYTTYFASTKTSNNNQIGSFGLGSKTPYSLVDEYTVISYYDNKKTTYRMCKVEEGPSVEKISEEPSSEETGLEIRFDIDENVEAKSWSIYSDFRREAINFFSKTLFQPNWNISLPDDVLLDFANSKAYFNKNSANFSFEKNIHNSFKNYSSGVVTINVAGVVFTVKDSEIFEKIDRDYFYFANPINIMANKEDVTVTPNRETLHYDDKTKNFIIEKVNALISEKVSELSTKLDNHEFNFTELCNISDGSAPTSAKDKARDILKTVFNKSAFIKFNNSSINRVLRNNIDSIRGVGDNPQVAIISCAGCKSQQEGTVISALKETGEKISSKAFKDRIIYYFKMHQGQNKSTSNIVLSINPGQEELAYKLLQGVNYGTLMYKDCVPPKSTTYVPKKRGFITSTTYVFNNYEEGNSWDRRRNNPYLLDNEIPLVLAGDIDRFTKYFPFLKIAAPNLNLVIRCVSEISIAKNVCSMTKAQNAMDWLLSIVNNNKNVVDKFLKSTDLYSHINQSIGFDVFCLDKDVIDLDELKKSAKSENAKELLDNILFIINSPKEYIWYDIYDLSKNERGKYKSFHNEYFPLLKNLKFYPYCSNSNDKVEFLKNVLDYVSLVENNKEYIESLKEKLKTEEKDKEIA